MFWELEAAQVRVLGAGGPYGEQKAKLKFWAILLSSNYSVVIKFWITTQPSAS